MSTLYRLADDGRLDQDVEAVLHGKSRLEIRIDGGNPGTTPPTREPQQQRAGRTTAGSGK